MSAIPKQILDHFPELTIINEALEQDQRGEFVKARCPTCGCFLTVTKQGTGKHTWVICKRGCTHYRS